MAKTESKPPAKKIGPHDIDPVFDKRDRLGEHGYPSLTAAQIADAIVERRDDMESLDPETVRNHLNKMVDSDGDDVAKFKHGPRTVTYGRPNDPQKVTRRRVGAALSLNDLRPYRGELITIAFVLLAILLLSVLLL